MQSTDPFWYHLVTVGSLVLFKLAVVIVGCLIAKLGHDLLIKGVSGQFKFHSELKGSKADLVSASPGIFFVLMATILITVGVIKDKPFETTIKQGSGTSSVRYAGERDSEKKSDEEKPILPPNPPEPGKNPVVEKPGVTVNMSKEGNQ